jgi:two-component system, NtrC family, response regulator AtoC
VTSLSPSAFSSNKVLLVENEADARESMALALQCESYAVELAEDGEEAVRIIAERHAEFSAVFLDRLMPPKGGLAALRGIRLITKDLPVFITSLAAPSGSAVEAIQAGATDFISKPVTHEELHTHMLRVDPLSPATYGPAEGRSGRLPRLWGSGRRMREIQSLVRRISESDVPVLIEGETGVGKEVLAREIHANSRRSQKPFLKLNCAALPSELVESELFGYERGAFTGAFQRKAGMFEVADRGTILLDEIGDMDFKLQAKLLMVLQDHEFQRLGGKETVRVDVRVMAATHRDLHQAIRHQAFREDLYYRLNVINVHIPPLRERKEDIVPLANHFLNKHRDGKPLPPLTPTLQEAILQYQWPGNVRELENLMQRFLVFRDTSEMLGELVLRSGRVARAASSESLDGVKSAAAVDVSAAEARPPERRSVLKGAGQTNAEIEAAVDVSVVEARPPERRPVLKEVGQAKAEAAGAADVPAAEARPPERRPVLKEVGQAKAETAGAVDVSAAELRPPEHRSVLEEVARAKAEAEAAAILQVLESTHWNRKRAAEILNIDYKALLYKMRKLSIGTSRSDSRALELRSGKMARVVACASGNGVASVAAVVVPAVEPRLSDGRSILAEVARAKAEAEAAAILEVLESTHWNRKQAAQVLNIDYQALLDKMRKLSIGTSGIRAPCRHFPRDIR